MRRFLLSCALLLATATVACFDHEPAAPSLWDVVDVYGFSDLRIVVDGDTTDITHTTYGPVTLSPDSTMDALLLVDDLIESPEGLTVYIEGIWTLRGSRVTMHGAPASFLNGVDFTFEDGRLTGVADVDSALLLIELDSEDDLDDGSESEEVEPDEDVDR